jgi:hypothetical protein
MDMEAMRILGQNILINRRKKRQYPPSFPAYQLISGVCLSESSTGCLLLVSLGRRSQGQYVKFDSG